MIMLYCKSLCLRIVRNSYAISNVCMCVCVCVFVCVRMYVFL